MNTPVFSDTAGLQTVFVVQRHDAEGWFDVSTFVVVNGGEAFARARATDCIARALKNSRSVLVFRIIQRSDTLVSVHRGS